MIIGIGLKSNAYTPEAYAYAKYLRENSINVELVNEELLSLNNDVNIYFMGVRPFWQGRKGRALEIHEYQSLSTPPYPTIKDFIKKSINSKPDARIFLNKIVHEKLGFSDNVPFFYRDMGVDADLFQQANTEFEYDIVYSGSVEGRTGLLEEFVRLAKLGFRLLIVGKVNDKVVGFFKVYSNVFFTGQVVREELPALYRKCRAGLNYTPDFYPYNIQTSTKTLEYLASNLVLVTNRYLWVENFCEEYGISPVWLDKVDLEVDSIYKSYSCECDMSRFSWDNILDNGFLDFINNIIEEESI